VSPGIAFGHYFLTWPGMVVIDWHGKSPYFAAGERSHERVRRAVIVRQEILQRELATRDAFSAIGDGSTFFKKKQRTVWPGFTMALDFTVAAKHFPL